MPSNHACMSMSAVRRAFLLGVWLCVAAGSNAVAAPAADESTPDKALTAAKESFEAAQNAFVRGEYAAAAEKFLAAYEHKPYPAFLFNVAVSFEKSKQLEKAKQYFERYLEKDPNASDAAQVKLRLEVHHPAAGAAPAASAAPTPAAATRWSRRGDGTRAGRRCADDDAARAAAASSAARCDRADAGADGDRDQGPGRHRLEAAGRDDLPERQAQRRVRQDALARLSGIEAGAPDPGVEGLEAGGARDQPALGQADRRLHRAVRGALPRLGRDRVQRSRRRRLHRSQGDRRHRPDAVHRPPEAGQAHDLRRAVRVRPLAAGGRHPAGHRDPAQLRSAAGGEGVGGRSPGGGRRGAA